MNSKILFLFLAGLLVTGAYAQEETYDSVVKTGTELIIAPTSNGTYQFIKVPRKNFIIKRGGIADYGSLANNKVEVTKIKKDRADRTIITFKRSDNSKFFNVYKTLSADLNKAISEGELRLVSTAKKDSLAK